MAGSQRTVTLQEILQASDQAHPTTRLKLREKATSLSTRRPAHPRTWERARRFAEKMFTKAQNEIELDNSPTAEATEKNKKKVKEAFKSMKDKLDKQERQVLLEMDTLSPTQQDDVATFWQAADVFFNELIHWLKTAFEIVLEQIRKGFRILKEVVTGLFDTVLDFLKSIF